MVVIKRTKTPVHTKDIGSSLSTEGYNLTNRTPIDLYFGSAYSGDVFD